MWWGTTPDRICLGELEFDLGNAHSTSAQLRLERRTADEAALHSSGGTARHILSTALLCLLFVFAGCTNATSIVEKSAPLRESTPRSGAPPAGTAWPNPEAMAGPYWFDATSGLVYANGRFPEGLRVVAWDPQEAHVVRAYPAGGPFVVDAADHRLFVDDPERGLDVFDLATGALLATVALPAPHPRPSTQPAPQFDPVGGVVYAFRGAQVLGVDVLRHRVIRSMDTQERIEDSELLPIAGAAFDPVHRLLYLIYAVNSSEQATTTSLLAVDAARALVRGRDEYPGVSPGHLILAPRNGRLYVLAVQPALPQPGATLDRWQNGFPGFATIDLRGDWSGGLVVDGRQGVVYVAGARETLVLGGQTLELVLQGPGAPGPLLGLDEKNERLLYVDELGKPRLWTLANLRQSPPGASPSASPTPE